MRVFNSVRAQTEPGLAAILSQPMLWTHDAILETASTRESDQVPLLLVMRLDRPADLRLRLESSPYVVVYRCRYQSI